MRLRLSMVAAVLLTALVAAGQDVKTDFDHGYNFAQLHTFAVKIGTSWGNPLSEDRAKSAIAKQLTAKGWTQTDEAQADALVVVHAASQTQQSLNTFYSGGGWGGYGWGGWGPGTATTTVSEVKVGTMVVDIFDAKTKKLVFRGVGQDEISNKPEKNQKKIEKATEKMFKNFPPTPKG
jgi:Domain of unknown function (DUF4136)